MGNWEVKREEILKRDNFTCQRCGRFNPELGPVHLVGAGEGDLEVHTYERTPNPYSSTYLIAQRGSGFTFNITFGDCWPVFPVLQVHHKRYVNGREGWDYGGDDLVTLCRQCHGDLHANERIPVYSTDGELLEERAFLPNDIGSGRRHRCEVGTFVTPVGSGGEYAVADLHPTIRTVVLAGEDPVEAREAGKRALRRLLERCFPGYVV